MMETARPARTTSPRKKAQGFGKPLPTSFYARDTREVAVDLLGKLLVARDPETGAESGGVIVETEAYSGSDPASHSRSGPTPRSAPMFEEPGRAYVYFTYGMYEMLNLVTEPKGQAGAVLIRGIAPTVGLETIARRRRGAPARNWTNGPARLCRALGIRMSDNRESLRGPRLFVYDSPAIESVVHTSPRIGITKAVELHWRFFYKDHPHVSPAKENRVSRKHGGRRGQG